MFSLPRGGHALVLDGGEAVLKYYPSRVSNFVNYISHPFSLQ